MVPGVKLVPVLLCFSSMKADVTSARGGLVLRSRVRLKLCKVKSMTAWPLSELENFPKLDEYELLHFSKKN